MADSANVVQTSEREGIVETVTGRQDRANKLKRMIEEMMTQGYALHEQSICYAFQTHKNLPYSPGELIL